MGLHSVRVNNQYRVEFSKQVPGTESEQPAMTIETNYFGITYNDAVEEALCFEWIDSTIKSLDKEHKIQRFTPRKPKSTYSQANKERLKWLLENNMIHPGLEHKIRNILSAPFVFPNGIINRLKEDKTVWNNYQQFSDAYKRIRIAYIQAAEKRPEEFEKRLNNFINKTKENKIITGFGGIEKYYESK